MKKLIGIFLFSFCWIFQLFGQEDNLQNTNVQDTIIQDTIPQEAIADEKLSQDTIIQKALDQETITQDSILQNALAKKLMEQKARIKECKVALDTLDEFDTTRMIATYPIKIGYLTPTKNLSENLDGETYTDEAKAIFSYAESEDRIRSFFLTIVVVEHQFMKIDSDFNVLLKLDNGKIIQLYNVPDKAELNRDIIMWQYQHTCVVPLEAYYTLKEFKIEKIRINYENYKKTIVLEPDQQQEMFEAILCVEERLKNDVVNP